ncbi:MAG: hypothetical protein HY019_20840 [Aquabacterium sp.]|uniref:hypothetical protein n=1 Tax=Aquabacterium sp. TaxID=1872578 RepID=UPI0025BB01D7|nr:hypothetical protein [Aquabacterium sp.]MBI3384452.1 hypothetical protein [Aquabacterium sp.]
MKKSSKSAPEVHERDVSTAQSEMVPEARHLAELRARIDQQLASLNAPSAYQAMNEIMDEPVDLGGRLRPEDAS